MIRTHKIILLLFSIFLWSCSQPTVSEQVSETATASNENVEKQSVPRGEAPFDPATKTEGEYWQSYFEGKLDDKIEVEFYLQRHEDLLAGTITYKSSGIPIRIFGNYRDDQNFFIREYAKGTEVSGMMSGTIKDGKIEGSWYPPSGDKERKLKAIATSKASKGLTWKNAEQNVAGEYSYEFPNEGGSGSLTVEQSGDKITFDAISVNGAPGYHIATIEEGAGKLVDHKVHYSMNDGECEFYIRFYRDFAYIEFVEDKYACDFGMGASIEGIFVKE